ncbi:MAG: hypothetical protein CVV23_01475 [Ignavibacteriae bacterium HGW-Ignavibacteriae-2]|jgi:hypothetical protein|nr:hypothetical protein [Bacteroidota bacterium]PKL90038.1 MAG: hypothetical protein CVV23_01475 [Ignavibacteriae bacterium HGW-Ignavibacteriae-2]
MKPLISVYTEGNETKIAVVSLEKDLPRVLKVFSTTISSPSGSPDKIQDLGIDTLGGDISFESLEDNSPVGADTDNSDVGILSRELNEFKLSRSSFIPVTTDPSVNFHVYEGEKLKDRNKQLDLIIKDIEKTKGIFVNKDSIDFVELDDKSYLCTFLESSVPCVNIVNQLAGYHRRRYYKIETIKNAEIALANYVSRSTKFFPEDYTLIIHIGKESSKLIFLEGQKLKHIGTTLDIGTHNLHTYDVYFSKILLEMENGGIPRLDNVVLCGDDRSENLVLSFYGTFPEANVVELKFENFDVSQLKQDVLENLSSFSIPIAAAYEFIREKEDNIQGINILPKYILDNQKFLQFGWHSYLMLALLFVATFFVTFMVLKNFSTISKHDAEIARLEALQKKNEEIINQIAPLTNRIANFDNTQAILDSATVGTEIWGTTIEKISNFVERRRNFWITHLETTQNNEILLKGFSLSRSSLTEFARDNDASIINNVLYEPLREKNAFSFSINIFHANNPNK